MFFYFISYERLIEANRYYSLMQINDEIFANKDITILGKAFSEGNYFNNFVWGNAIAFNDNKKLVHLNSHKRMTEFLIDNPLECEAYHKFSKFLKSFNNRTDLLLDFD